jgi:hypothetical protein
MHHEPLHEMHIFRLVERPARCAEEHRRFLVDQPIFSAIGTGLPSFSQ